MFTSPWASPCPGTQTQAMKAAEALALKLRALGLFFGQSRRDKLLPRPESAWGLFSAFKGTEMQEELYRAVCLRI